MISYTISMLCLSYAFYILRVHIFCMNLELLIIEIRFIYSPKPQFQVKQQNIIILTHCCFE